MNKRRRYQAKRRRLQMFTISREFAMWTGHWPAPYHALYLLRLLREDGRQ